MFLEKTAGNGRVKRIESQGLNRVTWASELGVWERRFDVFAARGSGTGIGPRGGDPPGTGRSLVARP
jgi:hypothetical protein